MASSSEASAHHNDDNMTPASTLDLLFITFNCAKNLVNRGVFASHLHGALTQNATTTGLPDLVVFSLQEVAPLSYSFMGPYFLTKYYAPYEEALNVAAARVLTTTTTTTPPSTGQPPSPRTAPYTLVRSNNIGMTSLLLFALRPRSISNLQDAVIGFGVQEMGNKGAVGCRFTYTSSSPDTKSTVLTFVATHLAAMEWNLKKRNANWRSIVSGLTFSNPKDALPGVFPAVAPPATMGRDQLGLGERQQPQQRPPSPASASSSEGSEEEEDDALPDAGEGARLLRQTSSGLSSSSRRKNKRAVAAAELELDPSHLSTLQELSIFAPATHLFLAGDLNYRISSTTPPPGSLFPSFYVDESDPAHWSHFLARDQLTAERAAGRTLHGLSEAEITFGPSYKYDVLPDDEAETAAAENLEGVKMRSEVPWKWAPHRWPSWCDRVLYLDLPGWVKRRRPEQTIETVAYDILPLMASSDHRPVFWRATVPILSGEEMLPPPPTAGGEEVAGLEEEDMKDPRVALPVAIDPHAWERRAAARRREVIAGWSMFVWATKEGAGVLGGGMLLGALTWWLWRVLG